MNISEVSRINGISSDTLRYYERIGLVPAVKRTKGGIRDYDENDMKWVNFAKCMRSAGLSIEVLTEYVHLFHQGDSTMETRRTLLVDQREQLQIKMNGMQETLDRLDHKIENYDTVLQQKVGELII